MPVPVVPRPPQWPHPAHPSYLRVIWSYSELLGATRIYIFQLSHSLMKAIHPTQPSYLGAFWNYSELLGATRILFPSAPTLYWKLYTPPIQWHPSYLRVFWNYLELLEATQSYSDTYIYSSTSAHFISTMSLLPVLDLSESISYRPLPCFQPLKYLSCDRSPVPPS